MSEFDLGALASGSGAAAAQIRQDFADAGPDRRKALLDQLVPACASAPCLDLLLVLLREHRLLHPPLRRYLLTEDDVDTAEQQALVSIAFGFPTYSGTGSSLSWMRQIAANEAKMLIRSRERHASRAEGTVDHHQGEFVQRMSTLVADEVTINRCLEQLRPDWREALVLREEGRPYDEVALRLGIPVGTAKTWVSRARRNLADLLIEQSMHEPD